LHSKVTKAIQLETTIKIANPEPPRREDKTLSHTGTWAWEPPAARKASSTRMDTGQRCRTGPSSKRRRRPCCRTMATCNPEERISWKAAIRQKMLDQSRSKQHVVYPSSAVNGRPSMSKYRSQSCTHWNLDIIRMDRSSSITAFLKTAWWVFRLRCMQYFSHVLHQDSDERDREAYSEMIIVYRGKLWIVIG